MLTGVLKTVAFASVGIALAVVSGLSSVAQLEHGLVQTWKIISPLLPGSR